MGRPPPQIFFGGRPLNLRPWSIGIMIVADNCVRLHLTYSVHVLHPRLIIIIDSIYTVRR